MILNNLCKIRFSGLLLIALIVVSGCGRKPKIRGPEYVERDVLVNVISDIYIMNGIANDMSYYRKFNPMDSVDLYTSIFEKYNINRQKYERTISAYSKHPSLLENVYNDVLMNLNQIQDTLDDGPEIE